MQIHREVKWSSAAKKEEESQGLGRQVPWAKLARVSCSGGRSLHFRAKGHLGVSPTHYFSVPLSSAQNCPLLRSGSQIVIDLLLPIQFLPTDVLHCCTGQSDPLCTFLGKELVRWPAGKKITSDKVQQFFSLAGWIFSCVF